MPAESGYRRPIAGNSWWHRSRDISVVVDNPSWVLPFAQQITDRANQAGDRASLLRSYDEIPERTDIAVFLGCVGLADTQVLARSRRNLVVHSSDLPKGRGFAPLAWQIIAGQNEIPTCLIEAAEEADSGPIVLRDVLRFNGTELYAEMREAQGRLIADMFLRFLSTQDEPRGEAQTGTPTRFRRRTPKDSEIDPLKPIADQFDLLRTVDNENFPAFFTHRGRTYRLAISPFDSPSINNKSGR